MDEYSDRVCWAMGVGDGVTSCAVLGAGEVFPLIAAAELNADTTSVAAAVIDVVHGSETSGQSGNEHGSTEQQPLNPFAAHR